MMQVHMCAFLMLSSMRKTYHRTGAHVKQREPKAEEIKPVRVDLFWRSLRDRG